MEEAEMLEQENAVAEVKCWSAGASSFSFQYTE